MLPLFARNPWVMLHEMAHVLTPDEHASHGPEFAGVVLFLVETVLGKDSGRALRAAYRDRRVRYSNAAIPSPTVVPSLAALGAHRRAAAKRPVRGSEAAEAARVLRRAVAQGLHGAAGTKQRAGALAAARALEAHARS
jgi:hypothetical protein